MRIEGLTWEQCELLDQMWGFETIEQLKDFINKQNPTVQREIMTLREMLLLSGIDEEVEDMNEYPVAVQMLKGIMK
jgi:hypothetical protein